MRKPILVGVTGGIGSGKSMVCQILSSLGVPVYYADDRAKALYIEDEELKVAINELFGEESYVNGQLNRAYLAERVFNDKDELAKMNALVHPAVAKDFEAFVERHADSQLILKEAALLYETGSFQSLDRTIAVLANKELRIKRVLLRDPQRSAEQVNGILEKQTSDNQRKKLADFIVRNDEQEMLIPQVMKIYNELLGLSS